MLHLVLGGTGRVGRALIAELLDRGESVRVLTRSAEQDAALPDSVSVVVGDLEDPPSVAAAFRGVDTLMLTIAVAATELQQGLVALEEARRAHVGRIVYLSVQGAELALHIPHFAAKVAMESALRASGLPHVILRPNNYFQNDHYMKDAILKYGVYPQPLGERGVSCVDVRDVAAAAARALMGAGEPGSTHVIAGAEPLTGTLCAERYSTALNREIHYLGDDLAQWGGMVSAGRPSWVVYDLQLMYAQFQGSGLRATAGDLAQSRAAVGQAPRRHHDFVQETVAAWGTSAS